MPQPDFFVAQNDTASSLTDVLRDSAGDAVDIAGADIALTVTPLGGGSAILDGAAANNDQAGAPTQGNVSYDWQAADTDTAGFYLGRWTVTFADNSIQSFPNAGFILIEISPDAPVTDGRAYVTLEELKASAELSGTSYVDMKIDRARKAASRAIDERTGRRFWLDTGTANARIYTPDSPRVLVIDDIVSVTSVLIDRTGDGVFEETWATTDYVLDPANAAADGKPYESIRVRSYSGRLFPCNLEHSVKVTGQYGWAQIPDEVVEAAKILTVKLLRRSETPFGVLMAGIDQVTAVRIARTDPDVATLLEGLDRRRPFL